MFIKLPTERMYADPSLLPYLDQIYVKIMEVSGEEPTPQSILTAIDTVVDMVRPEIRDPKLLALLYESFAEMIEVGLQNMSTDMSDIMRDDGDEIVRVLLARKQRELLKSEYLSPDSMQARLDSMDSPNTRIPPQHPLIEALHPSSQIDRVREFFAKLQLSESGRLIWTLPKQDLPRLMNRLDTIRALRNVRTYHKFTEANIEWHDGLIKPGTLRKLLNTAVSGKRNSSDEIEELLNQLPTAKLEPIQ